MSLCKTEKRAPVGGELPGVELLGAEVEALARLLQLAAHLLEERVDGRVEQRVAQRRPGGGGG